MTTWQDSFDADHKFAEEAPLGRVRITAKYLRGRKFSIFDSKVYPLAGENGRIEIRILKGHNGFQQDIRNYNHDEVEPLDDKARTHIETLKAELAAARAAMEQEG